MPSDDWANRSGDAFDDAEVALDAVREVHQRLLICHANLTGRLLHSAAPTPTGPGRRERAGGAHDQPDGRYQPPAETEFRALDHAAARELAVTLIASHRGIALITNVYGGRPVVYDH